MRILLYGDSITDAGRNRDADGTIYSMGNGYAKFIEGELVGKNPLNYEIINRGISGNRIVDLYARIKADVWNLQPDVLSILIGINDIWHEISFGQNGVDVVRFEKVYRMLIEDTLERLPNLKIILCEPFVLKGCATNEHFEEFNEVREYAKVVKKLAKEYNLFFLPLQDKFDEAAKTMPSAYLLSDGVHPNTAGAVLIAKEWLKLFKEQVENA